MSTRIVLMGAPPDTPNLGVSALGESTLDLLASHIRDLHVLRFDFSRSHRISGPEETHRNVLVSGFGSNLSRRIWRADSLHNMNLISRAGLAFHPIVRWMRSANSVLDVTGGDSFTDLYGKGRFKASTLRKLVAIRENPNLILLPQTYGPFHDSSSMKLASEIVKKTSAAWARDERSFDILKEMLGVDFDPQIHRCGMDQAFGLDETPCMSELPLQVQGYLNDDSGLLKIGLNISGLIFNDPSAAKSQYGFKVDYEQLVYEFIKKINASHDVVIGLVPHVLSKRGITESDIAACEDVHEWCSSNGIRSTLIPSTLDCRQMKWVINQFDWFCGTRMHSTIAALSGCTPVAAIAYSDKVQGVFDGCNVGDQVVDPRESSMAEILDRLCDGVERRTQTREILEAARSSWSVGLKDQAEAIAQSALGDAAVYAKA